MLSDLDFNKAKSQLGPRPGLGQLMLGQMDALATKDQWPEQVTVVHGSIERLSDFNFFFDSAQSFFNYLKEHSHQNSLLKIGAISKSQPGEEVFEEVSVECAERLFLQSQRSIVVRNIELIAPAIQKLLREISGDLGIPPGRNFANAYLSPAGNEFAIHSDEQDNFALQLLGRKEWKFAKNENIRYQRGVVRAGIATGASARLSRNFPKMMPESASRELLEPGSVIFVPRGQWHSTKTIDESLSVTFVLGGPAWMDLTAPILSDWMLFQASWREPIFFMDPLHHAERLEMKLENLSKELASAVLAPGFKQMISRALTPKASGFLVNSEFQLRSCGVNGNLATYEICWCKGGQMPLQFEVSRQDHEWLKSLSNFKTYFEIEAIIEMNPSVQAVHIHKGLRQLSELGILLRR